MKRSLFIALVVAVAACISYAEPSAADEDPLQVGLVQASLDGSGDLSGTIILWFAGTNVTAQVNADVALSGTLSVNDVNTAFTAKGTANGSGVCDMNTLAVSAWVTFLAHGTLATDEPITLRGGIELATGGVALSSETAGSGAGTLYVAVTVSNATEYLIGTVTGSASGGFVPPDDPTTMQMTGTGSLSLAATTTSHAATCASGQGPAGSSTDNGVRLPWKLDTWPEEMRQQLIELMGDE